MAEHYDVIVIGAGTAGNAASRALADAGMRVAVAEKDRVGGTCIWHGCMPKKALAHAAAVNRCVRSAEQFGIVPADVEIDWPGVLAWKWHAQESYAGDQDAIMESRGITRLVGQARFTSVDEIEVAGERYEADYYVVATGSRPFLPPVPGADLADTSDDALRYPELPISMGIVGAGYIGMEFAGIYASFGVKVTVLSRGEVLLPGFDPDVVRVARSSLEPLGVNFLTSVDVRGIEGVRGDLTIAYSDSGGSHTLAAGRVLLATGRRPDIDDLGLGVAGVEIDSRGMPVLDSSLRSSNPRVLFAGDAAGQAMHTPVASMHGAAVAATILGDSTAIVDSTAVPVACFTVPELAQVGLSEADALERGIPCEVRKGTFEYVGAAVISDDRQGLVKVVVGSEGRILGAQIAAPGASDLIYTLAIAVRSGMTVDAIAGTRAVHPAFTEGVSWAVR